MFRFRSINTVAAVLVAAFFVTPAITQKRKTPTKHDGRAVLWQNVNIAAQDTYLGPGGAAMQPDLSRVEFIKKETGGYSTKYRIRDGSGREWVAKIGKEAQSETAAVRLLAALGYHTEVNYLAPRLTIPGVGSFTNVRLEARPKHIERGDEWKWNDNPFVGSQPLQGLKVMMAFLNNWDIKSSNNVILEDGDRRYYAISDLGTTFGKTGISAFPLLRWIGRSRNKPNDYAKSKFVSKVDDDKVKLHFNGKQAGQFRSFSFEDARWTADLLLQLRDSQIRDIFRAANYSAGEIHTLTRAVKDRIAQLDRAASDRRIAGRK